MSGSEKPEPTLGTRSSEPPTLKAEQIREVRAKDLLVRFVAGGLTSIAAGSVAVAFGPKVGGILLAFPAILAASLTLIEEEEDAAEAREDSRGAILGGVALAGFAAVVAISLKSTAPGLGLVLGTLSWLAIAVGGYFLLWWRR